MTNLNDLLEPEDVNRLGSTVNAAIENGRSNADDYIDRWYSGEKAVAAKAWWAEKYAFCVEHGQVFVPENL